MRYKSILQRASLILIFVLSSQVYGAIIVVDVSSDGAGATSDCELRDAIEAANTDATVDGCSAGSGSDLIQFTLAAPVINLSSDLPLITESLEVDGPKGELLVIDGDDSHRIFEAIFSGGFLTIRDLHLFQGLASDGGCLRVIAVQTTLIEDVRFDSCASDNGSGGAVFFITQDEGSSFVFRRVNFTGNISARSGGAVRIAGSGVRFEDSLFQGNTATQPAQNGGALTIGGISDVTITRTTFWGNSAARSGTAIHTFTAAVDVTIEHSTFSQNNLTGTSSFDAGGTINNVGTMTLLNNVIAGNTEQNGFHNLTGIRNDVGGTLNTSGFNFIGNNQDVEAVFPAGLQVNGDQAGTAAAPLDPKLNALADNGGSTQTSMPQSDSPLINQGSCPGEIRDQRGYSNNSTGFRPILAPAIASPDDGCDTGAVEYLGDRPILVFKDGFEY